MNIKGGRNRQFVNMSKLCVPTKDGSDSYRKESIIRTYLEVFTYLSPD